MRTFLRAHSKALVAIALPVLALLMLLVLFTVRPTAAMPAVPLADRLRSDAAAIAATGHPRHIEHVLEAQGYAVRRQTCQAGGRDARDIEVSIANVAPNAKPARIFIVGAHVDTAPGAAAVLELARLLKDMRPSLGTEVKFVFFAHAAPPGFTGADTGSFIAYVGTPASARLVQDALSAFRAAPDLPARGLAAPAYVQGVTLSDHAAWHRAGYPSVVITDTAFMRYPYHHTDAAAAAPDAPDEPDYESAARVVQGLARTITALAAGAQG